MLQPHIIMTAQFNGKKVTESTYESVVIFFFVYIYPLSHLFYYHSVVLILTCISAAASSISMSVCVWVKLLDQMATIVVFKLL